MGRRAWWTLGLPLVGLAVGCDAPRGSRAPVLKSTYFDSSGAYPLAGLSTRTRPDVRPARPEDFGRDTATEAFHLYTQRCGSCHRSPDPTLREPGQWDYMVKQRMGEKMKSAGLLPMPDSEATAIGALLDRHAAQAGRR